jgi:hypothetical protein
VDHGGGRRCAAACHTCLGVAEGIAPGVGAEVGAGDAGLGVVGVGVVSVAEDNDPGEDMAVVGKVVAVVFAHFYQSVCCCCSPQA